MELNIQIRKMNEQEYLEVYKMGFSEWAHGKNFEEYSLENKREEINGERFIYNKENLRNDYFLAYGKTL